MNPHQRKQAQEEFRTSSQICVATEAAGEGINLQFCHLLINYDLPWNPHSAGAEARAHPPYWSAARRACIQLRGHFIGGMANQS